MKVYWSNTALAHLLAIFDRIAQDSDRYALQVADRLTKRSEQIGAFPLSGRVVPEYDSQDIREVIEGSHRMIYKVNADHVVILALLHGHRLLPANI